MSSSNTILIPIGDFPAQEVLVEFQLSRMPLQSFTAHLVVGQERLGPLDLEGLEATERAFLIAIPDGPRPPVGSALELSFGDQPSRPTLVRAVAVDSAKKALIGIDRFVLSDEDLFDRRIEAMGNDLVAAKDSGIREAIQNAEFKLFLANWDLETFHKGDIPKRWTRLDEVGTLLTSDERQTRKDAIEYGMSRLGTRAVDRGQGRDFTKCLDIEALRPIRDVHEFLLAKYLGSWTDEQVGLAFMDFATGRFQTRIPHGGQPGDLRKNPAYENGRPNGWIVVYLAELAESVATTGDRWGRLLPWMVGCIAAFKRSHRPEGTRPPLISGYGHVRPSLKYLMTNVQRDEVAKRLVEYQKAGTFHDHWSNLLHLSARGTFNRRPPMKCFEELERYWGPPECIT